MSKRTASSELPVTIPKLSTAPGTSLRDCLPRDGRDLPGEVIAPGQVCVTPSADDSDYDVTVSLPELVGFPKDFCQALESVGGCSLSLATKLLKNHQSDGGEFVAGRLCGTEEQ